ncbi:DUF4168 domain-containing protein [Ferruginivarius sediminum]|uniref:DUF4168 domain-containing protein n=1 Tax=Ferruginivarius sediminum TaxID=2661937 RepID=A0A369T4M3_9PROT|nr:DUF4168 domain-containing protein [Ferruginivarius sediminum]RDD60291.1 DUF4168 domain-containing protein [Ferruginivarius sediminum]
MFDRPVRRIALAVAIAAASLSGLGGSGLSPLHTAHAQSSQESDSASQPSEETLQAWVTAATKVEEVRRKWSPKIRAADEAGEAGKAKELSKKADREMVMAIKSTEGISLRQYEAIWEKSQKDKTLYRRLEKEFEAQKQQPSNR